MSDKWEAKISVKKRENLKEEGRRMKMGERRVEEGKREDCQGGQSSENGK
jgi:hypothetical protein